MKYIPKSKIGAVMAGLYLLLVSLMLLLIGTNETGGHANPIVLVIVLVFILTFPLSWAGVWILDVFVLKVSGVETANKTVEFTTMFVIFTVSALFNAAVIYVAIGFLSRAARSFFKRLK